jgi:hypothetical protein
MYIYVYIILEPLEIQANLQEPFAGDTAGDGVCAGC